mgnify:CR=1 FL=1
MAKILHYRYSTRVHKNQSRNTQSITLSALPEQPAQQATSDVVDDTTTQSRVGVVRGLTKLVTARESHGVGDCQDQGNN